jgi:3-methyladenine DNA glycosylase AlkD
VETKDDIDETFALAKVLINHTHDLIHKATGWMLREAGKKDIQKLYSFLDTHAATMPRTMLRYSLEKIETKKRKHYMNLHKIRNMCTA